MSPLEMRNGKWKMGIELRETDRTCNVDSVWSCSQFMGRFEKWTVMILKADGEGIEPLRRLPKPNAFFPH